MRFDESSVVLSFRVLRCIEPYIECCKHKEVRANQEVREQSQQFSEACAQIYGSVVCQTEDMLITTQSRVLLRRIVFCSHAYAYYYSLLNPALK